MSIEQNKAIALRLANEGWGTVPGWEKIWDELVAEDAIQHFCSAEEPMLGLDKIKAFESSLFQGFPNLKQTIPNVIAENDKVVYFHILEGLHTGNFIGIPPTGNRVKVTGFTMLKIANDKVIERWYETNLLEVMQQLEVIPRDS